MSEQKTTELEVENQAGNETPETEPKQPEAHESQESPYAKQLEDLKKRAEAAEAALLEKDEILKNKNRAIEASKAKLKNSVDLSEAEEQIFQKWESRQLEKEARVKIQSLTRDAAEQEVIFAHFKNVDGDSIEDRIKSAVALADRDRVWEQRRARALEEQREDFITGFSGTALRGDVDSTRVSDPIHAQAKALLENINPNAVSQLDKYFNK